MFVYFSPEYSIYIIVFSKIGIFCVGGNRDSPRLHHHVPASETTAETTDTGHNVFLLCHPHLFYLMPITSPHIPHPGSLFSNHSGSDYTDHAGSYFSNHYESDPKLGKEEILDLKNECDHFSE